MIDAFVRVFPQASGRDIRRLAKLVAKYCRQKNAPPDLSAFQRRAVFRGRNMAASDAKAA